MSQKNNDIIYTAADIEKYHKGLLSAKEMHAMEKASLDDPFLADALEGYALSSINAREDIADLKNRLANRTKKEKNKVIPLATETRNSFSWWKVAAMITLIAGAGLIVYQFGFNKKTNDIAQTTSKEAATTETKDSGKTTSPALLNTDTNNRSTTTILEQKKDKAKTETIKNYSTNLTKEQTPKKTVKPTAEINDTEAPVNAPTASNNAPASANANAERAKEETLDNAVLQRRVSAARREEYKTRTLNSNKQVSTDSQYESNLAGKIAGISTNNNQRNQAFKQTNIFRGRVTDAYNNALPFSNVTNTEDNIGTYSDAKGYFTLTSPDSVLNVQVRSVGFENSIVQLQNNIPNNQVQLHEDRSSVAEIVISNKKVNSNRSRNTTMVLEEPEPADGWTNYDLYLANNLKVPETFKEKQTGTATGEVELSFEVNKSGEPINITVKKSLCESCDKEAIRLIKEGPKWKRKAKKGKATVKVAF